MDSLRGRHQCISHLAKNLIQVHRTHEMRIHGDGHGVSPRESYGVPR